MNRRMDSVLPLSQQPTLQRLIALGLLAVQAGLPSALVLGSARVSLAQSGAQSGNPSNLPGTLKTVSEEENAINFQRRLDRIRRALDQENQDKNQALETEFETQGRPSFAPNSRPPFTNFSNPGARPELLPPLRSSPVQQSILDNKFGRYRLGPGDVIFLNVQRFPNLNFQGPITPEGTIVLPLVGTLVLEDLTVGEATERVRVAYDRYVVNPQVNLSLISQRPVRVTIVGRVANPGFYPLANADISEALRVAGGTLASADLRRVQIRRSLRGGRVIEQQLDLYAPLAQGLPFPDIRLEDGDTLTIPQLPRDASSYDRTLVSNSTLSSRQPVQVTVIGAVTRPGFYVVQTGRVGEAILVAGGSLNSANLKQIEVKRNFSDGTAAREVVDLYSPLAEGKALPNIRLEEGDVINIPKLSEADLETYDRRLIAKSNISKPDIQVRLLSYAAGGATTLNLPSGSTFRDALNGIPLDTAKLNTIALIRYDPKTGQATTQEIRGKDALIGFPEADVPLQDNDVVVIGRNLVSKITFALGRFTQPFRDILGFLLFFDSLADSASNLFQPDGSN